MFIKIIKSSIRHYGSMSHRITAKHRIMNISPLANKFGFEPLLSFRSTEALKTQTSGRSNAVAGFNASMSMSKSGDIMCRPRNTYRPSLRRRKRKHGFLSRNKTKAGRNTLKRRLLKGRTRLSASSSITNGIHLNASPIFLDSAIIYCRPRNTYRPSLRRRKRKHGFLSRNKTKAGRNTLKRRLLKGRTRLSASGGLEPSLHLV